MMNRFSSQFVFSVVLLIFWGCVFGEAKLRCLEAERRALLEIKEGLDEYPFWVDQRGSSFLSSWGKEEGMKECCNWAGVQCANNSGHVIILDLSPTSLGYDCYTHYHSGTINSSLSKLQHLIRLDLSCFTIVGGIPRDIGNLSKLKYLNLSLTLLHAEIPAQFSNFSSLHVLDLDRSYLRAKSLDWLSHLSSLRYLDLSGTNLSQVNDWMQVIGNLPYLTHLELGNSNLADVVPPSLSFSNSSSSLTHLGLCDNNLSVPIHQLLFHFSTNSLVHLDLHDNQLQNSTLEALWSMPGLEHLDLSFNHLEGSISKAFGRLSALKHLDLSNNHLEGSISKAFGRLSALKHLDLSNNHLEGSISKAFGRLSALKHLDLSNNHLEGSISKAFGRLSALKHLDLSNNHLDGSILGVFENITALEHLDLSFNHLEGFISVVLRNMNALAYLDLRNNMFGGEFPKYIGNITTLRCLYVGFNNLSGYLPESIGQLSELEELDISRNLLGGEISETHFVNLSKLSYLDLSSNSHLVLNVSFDWIPPFQLSYIILGDCKMAPKFPKWLQTQKNCYKLDISNVGISDFIPSWFWDLSSQIELLNLSNNQISGIVSNSSLEFIPTCEIDLSSNQIEGPIPVFLFKAASVNLSRNRFSKLDSLCDVNYTANNFLDISNNQLLGELPDCWSPFHDLVILVLTNNSLSGKIPFSFGSLTSIESLHLGENNLTEELPSSLKNCTGLRVLDVGENKLLGPIPTWIGENLSNLVILILRSNNFYGSMPSSLCNLSHLQLLDLSSNHFSGRIPKCFSNFSAMKENGSLNKTITVRYMLHGESVGMSWEHGEGEDYFDEVQFVWKGTPSVYKSILGLVKSIDLSSNKLMGEIPEGITELVGLVALNLSRNNLTGQIPSEMGRLIWLDALDLSHNHFSGKIPSSFSRLDRLPVLDLSNNNLSGKIPTSTQLQSFNATAYMGNQLCGAPLAKCQEEEHETSEANKESKDEEGQDVYITKGFYVSAAIGFVIAFWGVCGSLLLIKSRRHAYFKLLNDVQDWIYVTAAVNKAKMLRMTTG
ncbi:hypothetical protein UlMin_022205 [Ulmus minor]